ncbi:serine hydrolase [Deinococcus sp. PESE-13]
MPDFQAELRRAGYTGEVGLLVTDFGGRELYAHAADAVFPAASTIKVPLLLMALEQAGRGDLDLAGRVSLRAEDRVPGAGVLHELGPGLALSWQDVLTLMIVVSDNTATNLLIGQLGQDRFNRWLTARGLNSTRLIGLLQQPPERQNAAQRRGERNRTSAREQVALLLGLLRGEGLTPQMQHLALDILSRQHLRDLIGRGVPAGPDGEPLYRVASKSGELRGVHHDVGLLWTPRPLVVALLSQGGEDPREHPANRDVTRLSAALWPLLAELGETETP